MSSYDFLTPPNEKKLSQVRATWQKHIPHIPPPRVSIPKKPTTPKAPKAPHFDLGDLLAAPSLSTYDNYMQRPDILEKIAPILEKKGEKQRALLAWERLVESPQASAQQYQQSKENIQRLKTSLPPWNPDPLAAIPLSLHIGATPPDKALLLQALKDVAHLVESSSGYTIRLTTSLHIGKGKTPLHLNKTPMAIWIKGKKEETLPLSFMVNPYDSEALKEGFLRAVFMLLISDMKMRHIPFLPTVPDKKSPVQKALFSCISRHQWELFAKHLSL